MVGREVAALGMARPLAGALAASSSPKWKKLLLGAAATLVLVTPAMLSIILLSCSASRPGSDLRGSHCTSAVWTLVLAPVACSEAPKWVT